MSEQTDLFTLKEVIKPKHTLTSFGYKTVISPDNNTIVVLDCENSFTSFYTRNTINSNSPFVLANQFPKPEFKNQYILTDAVFNNESDRCYVGVKYCDYVNYDLDIRRNSFLLSTIVYLKQITLVPVTLENTVIYEKKAIWSYFVTLPYIGPNGYQLLHSRANNAGLFALTKTFGNYIELYYQSLNSVNVAIQYSTSIFIIVDKPVFLGTFDNITNIKFGALNFKVNDCLVYTYNTNQNLYKRMITSTSIDSETIITNDVFNFSVNFDRVTCHRPNKIQVINLGNLNIEYSYDTNSTDYHGVIGSSILFGRVAHVSNVTNQLRIYGETEYTYSNNYPFSCASFNEDGNTLVLGQPKNGRVVIFYYDEGWSLYQELILDGFSYKFDIDSEEKTLVITNNTEKITDIYENISYDFTTLQKSSVQMTNTVNSTYSDKYFESINLGFKNVILSNKEHGTKSSSGTLYQNLPYYITADGNSLFTIYESMIGESYLYHIYTNDTSGNQFLTNRKLSIYTQSGPHRLKNITSDRRGETVILLRQDDMIQLYKRVNLTETEETYAYIRMDIYDFRDIWTNIQYDPMNNGSRQAINKVQFNHRGNIIVVQQGKNIIILHYEQEIMFRQKTVGNPKLGTDISDSIIPEPITENGYRYIYFKNYYYLLSEPIVTYILDEELILMDENDIIYTWSNDKINVYTEDNFYRTKIQTIPFEWQLIENIRFFPEERLFTRKDSTNIYFYYYDKLNHTLMNTNVSIPICERFHIIDNHIIQYNNKNLRIDRYAIDVIQNEAQVDFSFNTIYTDTIDTTYNIVDMNIDYRNNINIFFRDPGNCICYRYSPTSFNETKYKYMITFREQKIDVDLQYKNEEFYNNVIQVLPKNYTSDNQSQSQEGRAENENQFKIYCPQKFTYSAETSNNEIHTLTPNLNKPVIYENEIVTSKYFDPKSYTTLNAVLRHMNSVNDNRALSLYRITEKRYVGMIVTMKGGKDLVRHKYTLLDKDDDITLIHTKAYTEEVNERISSVGIKFYRTSPDAYIESAIPDIQGRVSGIYVGSEVPIRNQLRIKYEVDLSSSEVSDPQILYPQDITIYLMTELTIDIITEETIKDNAYLINNELEYGKFTNISPDGKLIMIGSDLDTNSNVIPQIATKKNQFNIWIQETFIDPDANFMIGGINGLPSRNEYRPRDDITFKINWDVDYTGKDDGLTDYIDLKKYNRIQKLEDFINANNLYYGTDIIKLEYNNYFAVKVRYAGGIGGRTMWFAVNNVVMIKTINYTMTGESGNVDYNDIQSPRFGKDNKDTADVAHWSGVSPNGAIWSGAYYPSSDTSRPINLNYSVWWSGGTEGFADWIQISYVLNAKITFTEEYLQRYHYNIIKYGCLFYYMKEWGRWRHLNTLCFNNSRYRALRPSKSTIIRKFPEKIELLNDIALITSNTNHFIIKNLLYDNSNIFSNLYIDSNQINIKYNLTIQQNRTKIDALYKNYRGSIYHERNITYDNYDTLDTLRKKIDIPHTGSFRKINTEDSAQNGWILGSKLKSFYSQSYINFLQLLSQQLYFMNVEIISNKWIKLSLNFIYQSATSSISINVDNDTFSETAIDYNVIISFSPELKRQVGFNDNITLDILNPVVYIPFKNPYSVNNFKENNYGKYMTYSKRLNYTILGSVENFQIINNNLTLYNTFKIKDKIGNLYLTNDYLYNSVPEKGLIKKYPINTIDLSFNNIVTGTQLFQEYSYSGFGTTFSIFNNLYAVIGTVEGKVIIQHLNNKNAAKAVVNSGSANYSKFGSVLRTGKYIYINAPELNKLYILNNIPYYE